MSKLVYLDAGHGTPNDRGTENIKEKRYESFDTLKCVMILDQKFKEQGVNTLLSRTDENGKTLSKRTSEANNAKCNLYLSVHRNGFINDKANGVEIWLHSLAPQPYKTWAANILYQLNELGFTNRGVKVGHASGSGEYAINRDTVMPSMLLEIGFISNSNDNVLFDTKLSEICDAIVKSSCEFMKVDYKEIKPNPVPITEPIVEVLKPNIPENLNPFKVLRDWDKNNK